MAKKILEALKTAALSDKARKAETVLLFIALDAIRQALGL